MSTDLEEAQSPAAVELVNVWVQYRLRHAHHYNLKRTISNALTFRREQPDVITAIEDCSLRIDTGERVGISGPNGSGKSTLLSVLAGLRTPSHGQARVKGRVLALLGGPSEGLDPELNGLENARALGIRLGQSPHEMEKALPEIIDFSGLGSRAEHPVYTYSSGMQVRLRFSTITALGADILIADEGIGMADAEFNERAAQRLEAFYQRAGTLILATHSDALLDQFCQRRIALQEGRIHSDRTHAHP
jgi:lipopolysaccharide transport system ATP-binding protein